MSKSNVVSVGTLVCAKTVSGEEILCRVVEYSDAHGGYWLDSPAHGYQIMRNRAQFTIVKETARLPNLADEIERLLAAEAQADAAYQAAERSWGIGKQSSTHSERTARDAAYDATTCLLRSRAPAIVANLRRVERLEAALLRLGKAVLAGGPPDDIGPPPEVVQEYYAASDAVKQLAVEMAQEKRA